MDFNDIVRIYKSKTRIPVLKDDAVYFLLECKREINIKMSNNTVLQFINSLDDDTRNDIIREINIYKYNLKNTSKINKNTIKEYCDNEYNIKKDKFQEIFVNYIIDECITYKKITPVVISSYDLITMICYNENLYKIFENIIPNFPYFDPNIFEICIEKSFGKVLSSDFSYSLENYLRMKLAFIQHFSYDEIKNYIQKLTGTEYIAPLNLYGVYITYLANNIKLIIEEKYGTETALYTFLHLNDCIVKLNLLNKNLGL